MNTTTTPTPQRLEQALETFVENLEGFEGAVQRFEEALLKLEEGALEGLEDNTCCSANQGPDLRTAIRSR